MTSARADTPLSDETFYGEILASILQRFIHLVGEPTALKLARRVPELVIDHHGHVLDYNRDDPVGCIQRLLDEYADCVW